MSFLESVTLESGAKPVSASPTKRVAGQGSFLSSVVIPEDQTRANEIAQIGREADEASKVADEAGSFGGLFKQTAKDIWSSTKSYFVDSTKQLIEYQKEYTENPIERTNKTIAGFSDSVIEAASQGFDTAVEGMTGLIDDYKQGTGSTAGDVANLARILGGTAGVLFSPVSGAISGAQKVPVLRQIADIIEAPATTADIAAKYGTGEVFDAIPERYLSNESKELLRGPIGELSSLAAQVVLGSKISSKMAEVIERGRAVTPAEANRIVTEVKAENPNLFADDGQAINPSTFDPVKSSGKTAAERHAEYARAAGYEPYVPPQRLPVIQMGKGGSAPSDLPIIKANAPKTPRIEGDIEYVPVPSERGLPDIEPISIVRRPAATETTPKVKPADAETVPAAERRIDGEGDNKIAGLAKSVEKDAIANDLASDFGSLPEYRRMDMKEQSERALDFIKRDPDGALEVALGNRIPDDPGLLSESVYTAMRILAREAGDVGILRRLAVESRLVSSATALGQRIKALDSGLRNDPVDIIQDIKAARERGIERKTKGSVTREKERIADEIKEAIKRESSKRPTWEEFITEIQCQY